MRATQSLLITLFIAATAAAVPAQMYRAVSELPSPRQMHGSVVLGDHLYVVGGELGAPGDDAIWADSVFASRIAEDGSLGPWIPNTPMPAPRAYISSSTLAVNDRVYVAGGSADSATYSTVLVASPGPDGKLSDWKESTPFGSEGTICFPVVSTPGWIHLLGGLVPKKSVSAAVRSGRIEADGQIREWVEGPALPRGLWFHNASSLGGRVWVWGGVYGMQADGNLSGTMYSAPILGDGQLGEWRTELSTLPQPFYSAAGATAGPFLMSFAPRYAKRELSNDLWFARMDESTRTIGAWKKMEGAPPVKLYFPVASDFRRGFVYVVAGRFHQQDGGVDNNVYLMNLGAGAKASSEDQTSKEAYTYKVEGRVSEEALSGFQSYTLARAEAAKAGQPLIVYFHNRKAKPAAEQRERLASVDFTPLRSKAALAWVDTPDWPQMVRELGVYKVPTWIVYSATGEELLRTSDPMTLESLSAAVQ
jgi:hypothetical protein